MKEQQRHIGWTPELILEEILRANDEGVDLLSSSIQHNKEYSKLHTAAIRIYDSWAQAIEQAGIDYFLIRDRKKEERRKKIVAELQEAHNNGVDLRHSKIQRNKDYPGFYKRACVAFGNWRKALTETGISYEIIKREIRDTAREKERKELIDKLKQAHSAGIKLNVTSVIKDRQYKSLYWTAKKFYTGKFFWENTLRDAEINPLDVVLQQKWDKEKIVRRLRERSGEGKQMNVASLQKNSDFVLYKAALHHFNSYDEALGCAGLNPDKVRKRRAPFTKEEIIKGIIIHHIKGRNLNQSFILSKKNYSEKLRRLLYSAQHEFGDWENAVSAAGIDYVPYKKRFNGWSNDRILAKLKLFHELGESLNTNNVILKNNSLYKAGINHFGSWKKTIEAYGLNYASVKKQKSSLSRDEIVRGILELLNKGISLDITSIFEQHDPNIRRLYYQANKRFNRGWGEAIQKAGLDYSKIRLKREKYTLEELTQKIWELKEQNISLRPSDLLKHDGYKRYVRAAMHRHDSWFDFLNSIGIDASQYIRVNWKNGATVIEYLKEMFPAGIVTGVSSKDQNLREAARRYFGTIENATKKAGLVYSRNGKITKKRLEREPDVIGALYQNNKDFLNSIADRIYYGSISRKSVKMPQEDLRSEAFMLMLDILPHKPPKAGLREFMHKQIFYRLKKLNQKYMREYTYGDEVLLDVISRRQNDEHVKD